MISFKLKELCDRASGSLEGSDLEVRQVSTDSRDCKGALFVALKGERFDGHDFVRKAIDNGAAAVAVQENFSQDSLDSQVPVLHCRDTLRLYGLCGALVREKCPAKVVSLTGSCGKTTVKEFTASMLSTLGKTLATEGNFNNDVGVPKTLLRLTEDTDYAVIEQGASHLQDIARTCEFVKAQVALINNVGKAHIEGFGSSEGVYKGKSEILDDVLSRGGLGIVPTDSEWYERWRSDYATAFSNGRIFTFGTKSDAYVRVSEIRSQNGKLSFALNLPHSSFAVGLKLLGAHNALNAAAAACLTLVASGQESAVKSGILNCQVKDGRLKALPFEHFMLIDDAYNASFNAVMAALDTLSTQQGSRVMIFGDMGELGAEEEDLHRKVGEHARGLVDELLCVGRLSELSAKAMGQKARHFADKSELYAYLDELLERTPYATFLVKGSHAMHMDEVIAYLKSKGEQS
ncbi:MAG: UDP-N-acetylmuramoyl-tripeptide--D-alanyl-D-alanine ligase [Succinivibrio sp.]|nr:UDP-N-acetylmuramoyl-tripeptide--D-alanyl-D-alanine ligase [Succinivibrio sp.]